MSTQNIDYGIPNGQLKWETGFRATRDDNNKWTGSESFQCLKADLTKLVPLKGAPCEYPGFSFMTCTEVEVENLKGGFDRVTVKYSGAGQEGDFTFDDDDEDAQDPEFDKYTYQLAINTSQDPIETHPKFRNIVKKDRQIIFWLIRGDVKRSEETVDGTPTGELKYPYRFIRVDNAKEVDPLDVSEDEAARKLVDYLMNGVTTYRRARQIWRCSYNSVALPSASILNAVGKITSAKGAPPLADDRNWLFVGVDAQYSNGLCATTLEWELSESGGNDTYLYGLN